MVALLTLSACTSGPLAPSCDRRTGSLIDATGTVAATATISYEVASPANANLFITVSWSATTAELGLRATVLACGVHAGCEIGSTLTSARTQPTMRQLQVDGSLGKRYRIDVLGDPNQEQVFTIRVTYDTGICT
jgi:hypothetical protein